MKTTPTTHSEVREESSTATDTPGMSVKVRKVYRCEFCGKTGLRPIRQHVSRCTANPDRECHWKWRSHSYRDYGVPHCKAGELRRHITWCKNLKRWNEKNLDKLRERVDGCPACMLAVMRQARPKNFAWSDDRPGDVIWHFEKEKQRFNEELQQEEMYEEHRAIEASWL